MRRSTVVVAVMVLWAAAGCQDDEHFPPGEGGGPSGGGGSGQNDGGGGAADAGPADASTVDAGAQLAGELCDVVDVRDPLDCPTNVNLSGIEVRALGSAATDLTDADGNFTLSGKFDTDLRLSVGSKGDGTRLALVPVADWNLGGVRAPRVDQDLWNQLIAAIGTNEPDGSASIALYVLDVVDGQPVIGAVVSTVSDTLIFYDDGAATEWNPIGGTGELGAALILSVPPEGTAEVTVDGVPFEVPVEPDHLTWARVEV